MKIIRNNIIPFKGYSAINIFGILFVRNNVKITDRLLNHEGIHTKQIKETGYVLFYPLYVLEWFIKLFVYGVKSYRNISFERDAYEYQYEPEKRTRYNWLKRIFK